MQFKDVVGQHQLIEKITQLVNKNHLPHAIMLLGKEGSGGFPLALALAQYIQCEQRTEMDSCGVCGACIKVDKLQHPDVHFSFPTIKIDSSKVPVSNDLILPFRKFIADNPYATEQAWLDYLEAGKQGNITAAECREIIKKLQLRSFESEYKILIMWGPENLGTEGNILLKLIEEPTEKTILIFVANQLDKVLATIQSRTQLFPLQQLSIHDIQEALMASGCNEQKAAITAKLCDGSYYYAQQIVLEHEGDLEHMVKQWFNCLYQNKGLELVDWVTSISEMNKETQKRFVLYVIQLFEHLLRLKYAGLHSIALLESEQKIIENLLSKGVNEQSVIKVTKFLNSSVYEIERNANSKILFHSLSLRVQQIVLKHKTLAEQR